MPFDFGLEKVISKVVNGKQIYKRKGTKGHFYVDISPAKTVVFKTLKEAEKYIKNNLF